MENQQGQELIFNNQGVWWGWWVIVVIIVIGLVSSSYIDTAEHSETHQKTIQTIFDQKSTPKQKFLTCTSGAIYFIEKKHGK